MNRVQKPLDQDSRRPIDNVWCHFSGQRGRRFAEIGGDRHIAETSSLVVGGEQTLDFSANAGISPARVFDEGRAGT